MRLLTTTAIAAAIASTAHAQDLAQAGNDYFQAAAAAIEAREAVQPNTNRAKNVILIVGDGHGVATNYATRLWMGQQAGGPGDDFVMHHETFPNMALLKTYQTNAQTADSVVASAMVTGVKGKFGVVGLTDGANLGDCSTVEGNIPTRLSEIATEMGKSVGVVTTTRLTHATPAAMYAASADRDWEDNTGLPEGCDSQKDIAAQLIDAMQAGVIDVAMGGGRRHFAPVDVTTDEGGKGRRTDDRNLIEEAKALGAQYAWNTETFGALKLDGTPILGLFEDSHMKYEHDRAGEPSIKEMALAAVEALSKDEDGFFLMVEGGRVDHANHDGNLHRTVTDAAALVEAIQAIDEATNDEDTLILISADHAHNLAFNGYCGRGSSITGLCMQIVNEGIEARASDQPNTALDGKPYTVAGYLNGAGSVLLEQPGGEYFGSRPVVDEETATSPDYLQQALIPLTSETHSGVDVPAFAKGPYAHLLGGVMEQNALFHIMYRAMTAE